MIVKLKIMIRIIFIILVIILQYSDIKAEGIKVKLYHFGMSINEQEQIPTFEKAIYTNNIEYIEDAFSKIDIELIIPKTMQSNNKNQNESKSIKIFHGQFRLISPFGLISSTNISPDKPKDINNIPKAKFFFLSINEFRKYISFIPFTLTYQSIMYCNLFDQKGNLRYSNIVTTLSKKIIFGIPGLEIKKIERYKNILENNFKKNTDMIISDLSELFTTEKNNLSQEETPYTIFPNPNYLSNIKNSLKLITWDQRKNGLNALWRSLIFPGWGQNFLNYKIKALVFSISFITIALEGTILFYIGAKILEKNSLDLKNFFNNNELKGNAPYYMIWTSLISAGIEIVIYLSQAIESFISGVLLKRNIKKVSIIPKLCYKF